jgi:uncharacterized protein (TIGR02996 family)
VIPSFGRIEEGNNMIYRRGVSEVHTAADSPDELSLLFTVVADLSDPTPKLVYADWLEERGDPRGEFLREFVHRANLKNGVLPPSDDFPLPWRHVVGIRAIEIIRKHEARQFEKELLRRARPVLHIDMVPTADELIPPGDTKFGGHPDIPPEWSWPFGKADWRTKEEPLTFHCQIRLRDLLGTLASYLLPTEGLISVFGYIDSARVYLFEENCVARSRQTPPHEEIDVDGRIAIPSLGGARAHRIICECKAYSRPVDLPAWLKFCGKLFNAEKTRSETVHGCFIALSGVNGNVRGNYNELREHSDQVELVQGDALRNLVERHFNLVPLERIRQVIAQRFGRTSRNEEVAYYDNAVYWIVFFQGDAYTVASSQGEPLSLGADDPIRSMITESLAAGQFIDLREELNARRRRLLLDTLILEYLMINAGRGRIADAPNRAPEVFDESERRESAQRLVEAGLIAGSLEGEVTLVPSANVFMRLFAAPFSTTVLCSNWYTQNVNVQLLEEIRAIQANLPLPQADRDIALRILRYSPSALHFALQPNPMLHHGDQSHLRNEITDQMDRDYFMQAVFDYLLHDFRTAELQAYFHAHLHLEEIEVLRTYNIKFVPQEVVAQPFRERLRICRVGESAGGGLVSVRLRNDVPEPWEPMRNPNELVPIEPPPAAQATP